MADSKKTGTTKTPPLPNLSLSDPAIPAPDLSQEVTPLPVKQTPKKETAKVKTPEAPKEVTKSGASGPKKIDTAKPKAQKEEKATERIEIKPKGPYHYLHLIRHGQYVIDKKQDDFGFLTNLGQQQSQLVSEKLLEFPVTNIHSSDHARALETAKIIQRNFPDLEVKESSLLAEGIPWYPGKIRRQKGLSFWTLRAHRKRMDQGFEHFFAYDEERKEDLHEVMVTHGNVIRYFVCLALEIDIRRWTRFEVSNCSITTVRIDPTGIMKLIRFGEIGHVPTALRTIT